MEKLNEETKELSQKQIEQVLLDLIYSVKTLAGNVDVMHQDLRRVLEEEARIQARELDRIREFASKNTQILQILPIQTADRLERLIDKKVDGVLEDVRISINEVRQKLSSYIQNKDAQAALPPAAIAEDISDVTTRLEFKKDVFHFHVKTAGIEKAWKIIRWIAAIIAAGGGGWALIKNLFLKS
jgi:hypothetical protein